MVGEIPSGDEAPGSLIEIDPAFQDFITDIAGEDVYRDAALQYLNVQITADSEFNARNLQIFAIATTILPLTFALLSIADRTPPSTANWFLGAAVVAYLGLIVISLTASTYDVVQYRPNLLTLENHLEHYSGLTLLFWVGREYRLSTESNDVLLSRKGRLIGFAWLALCFEGAFISFAALFTLL